MWLLVMSLSLGHGCSIHISVFAEVRAFIPEQYCTFKLWACGYVRLFQLSDAEDMYQVPLSCRMS